MQGSTVHGKTRNAVFICIFALTLGGCLVGEEEANTDQALTISGSPVVVIIANSTYEFVPSASSSDNGALSFSVFGLPGWANFDSSSGRISGTPGDADVGTYSGIEITVSDGVDSSTLGPFTVTVEAVSPGSVTLNWSAPTENSDGTVLVDLVGYRIYWGTSLGSYPNSTGIDNPSVSTYVVENLVPGTYRFIATSVNSAGVESEFSNMVTAEVL